MRYRLLYGIVIGSVVGIAAAIFSQQPVMAANAVPPEHIFCTAVAAEIRDHKVGGEVYKACFYQGKQVNVERITCPAGSFEEVSGSATNSTVVRRCVSSAPRCKDGLKEINGKCVDTKKNREETFHIIKDKRLDTDSIGKKAYASFQSSCRGNSECLNTDYDKFLRTYFADQVYLCMQPAATAAEQAKTELGLQGGTAPDEVFANCLVKTYPSVSKAAAKQKAKDIDFIKSLATINQKTTSDKITDKPAEDRPQGENAEAERSCGENLEGLGWVICPAMSLGSAAADGAMEVLKQLLDVRPQLLDKDSGTYQAWTYFRNLANIVFVILFLWVIFSQMTSVGITNYGIKKVLPRLIIGAVLVNLSYYIAQIAVDVSNILGYSLEQMFQQAAKEIGGSNPDALQAAGTWVSWAGTALVSTAIVTAVVVLAGGSVLLASLLAIAVVLAILITRQAVVILLVAISPLAFAAWLLPNTEPLFKRWLSTMKAMLVAFPAISLLYGASSLASKVLMTTATGGSRQDSSWLLQLSALAVLFLPLGATPFVLRSSLNSLGTIGQKLGNLSDKANRRIGGKVKESSRLGEAWKNYKFKSIQRQANRRAGNSWIAQKGRRLASTGGSRLTRGVGRVMSAKGDMTQALDSSKLGSLLGGTAGAAAANARADEMFEQEVKAAALTLSGKTMGDVRSIAASGKDSSGNAVSGALRAAAMDKVMSEGGFSDRRQLIESVASDDKMANSTKQRVIKAAYAKGDQNIYGVGFGDQILSGNIRSASDLASATVENAAAGNLQAEHMVQSAGATGYLADSIIQAHANNNPRAAAATQGFRSAASEAISNSATTARVSDDLLNQFSKV